MLKESFFSWIDIYEKEKQRIILLRSYFNNILNRKYWKKIVWKNVHIVLLFLTRYILSTNLTRKKNVDRSSYEEIFGYRLSDERENIYLLNDRLVILQFLWKKTKTENTLNRQNQDRRINYLRNIFLRKYIYYIENDYIIPFELIT